MSAPILSHLVLLIPQVATEEPGDVSSCLAAAHSLKTLQIAIHPRVARTGGIVPEGIDLSQLRNLTAVNLERVVPKALTLPQGCRLKGEGNTYADANAQVWHSVKKHTEEFVMADEDHSIHSQDQLPEVLLTAPPRETVEIICSRIGRAHRRVLLARAPLRSACLWALPIRLQNKCEMPTAGKQGSACVCAWGDCVGEPHISCRRVLGLAF